MIKRNKYGNKKITYEGITFDSQKECKRYKELQMLQRLGKIESLELQPKFTLVKGVKFSSSKRATPAIRYYADFAYIDTETGERVVEDVKSEITRQDRAYKMKRHMMLAIHDIEVVEI